MGVHEEHSPAGSKACTNSAKPQAANSRQASALPRKARTRVTAAAQPPSYPRLSHQHCAALHGHGSHCALQACITTTMGQPRSSRSSIGRYGWAAAAQGLRVGCGAGKPKSSNYMTYATECLVVPPDGSYLQLLYNRALKYIENERKKEMDKALHTQLPG